MNKKPPTSPEPRAELYSLVDGEMCDAHIHEQILAEGDSAAAAEVTKQRAMREFGWPREKVDKLFG
jgi:hypothetical protein